MTEERKSLPQVLRALGSTARLVHAELKGLTGLDPSQREEFWPLWQRLQAERRAEIADAIAEMTEDSFEYDFGQFWYWLLDDTDLRVRTHAVHGLWEDESPRMLRRFLTMLRNDPAEQVRAAVAAGLSPFAYLSSLEELDSTELADALEAELLATLRDPHQPIDVRRRALESAGYLGGDDISVQIQGAYRAAEQPLRESALVAMGRSMDARWLPTIARELGSHVPALRYEAARAAGEYSDQGSALLPPLVQLLNDDDTEVALAAIWSLGQIGGSQAKRALQQVQKSKDEARSEAAEEALQELSLGEGLI